MRALVNRSRHALVGTVVAIAVAAAGLAVTSSSAAAAPESGAEIRPELEKRFETQARADFWVRLDERADLAAASRIKDWDARGEAVVEALKATAEESQGEVIEELEAAGANYTSYWATNAILVESGTEELANSLSGVVGVESLWPQRKYAEPAPVVASTDDSSPQAVEWGIDNINADDVWSQLGVDGDGIVIANIDTGVQYDHPALVGHYRGNNGDGTFSHDYNWLDTTGNCSQAAPCDDQRHGTHTMGTMVGGDGAENRIGVAPGARWITANGCSLCFSDDLIQSGQWMLAPTKLDGTAADASMRPNIVNNSWGSREPSNDPFMEDIAQAWAASGIFGVWSNGNAGPECRTSGRPGSRTINYSVGAYDVNNKVADFSARGDGQDGTIKPDIAAPGVNIRSAVPGSAYGTANGTSMAAPHVAGALALLWSASPTLIGDITNTWQILDDTAIDTEDLQCGGTADDNNVYGEGRLDALALVRNGNLGPVGTVAGTVTDDATGKPIPGAKVRLVGEVTRSVTVGGDGGFAITLPVGEYAVSTSAYGYATDSRKTTVAEDGTVSLDVAMAIAPRVEISGTVTDGSGHGWPLYAKITARGIPEEPFFTDPATGEYTISLPEDAEYELDVDPVYPGYPDRTETVEVGGADVTRNVAVPVDRKSCAANGYAYGRTGLTADFTDGALAEGWSIADHNGSGRVWRLDDPASRGNLTGGEGGFAIIDSKFYGSFNAQNTSVVSPAMDFSDAPGPVVEFDEDFNRLYNEKSQVELSIDGGETWRTVLNQTYSRRGQHVRVELPQAAGEADVRVRFHYEVGNAGNWWQIDNVFFGDHSCQPIVEGGYLVGHTYDANTEAGVNGAEVRLGDQVVTTRATPEDAGVDDGFYWVFGKAGEAAEATATAPDYVSHTQQVTLDGVRETDFALRSGRLEATPGTVGSALELGDASATAPVTITNTGTAPAAIQLGESDGGFVMQVSRGETGAAGPRTAAGLDWLSVDVDEARLAPGESVTVRVTSSARVAQPGRYTGLLKVDEDTPYAATVVPVEMTVTAPKTWGKLTGTVSGVGCDGTATPLEGATVQVDSTGTDWTLTTAADGTYAYWIDGRHNPLDLIAAMNGFKPQSSRERVKPSATTSVDFDLPRIGC